VPLAEKRGDKDAGEGAGYRAVDQTKNTEYGLNKTERVSEQMNERKMHLQRRSLMFATLDVQIHGYSRC
jgi:hypothetical protein